MEKIITTFRQKRITFFLCGLLSLSSFSAAAEVMQVSRTSGAYVQSQIPDTLEDQSFFEAWLCQIQEIESIDVVELSEKDRYRVVLKVSDSCSFGDYESLVFEEDIHVGRNHSYGRVRSFKLKSPLSQNPLLNRGGRSGLKLSLSFGDPSSRSRSHSIKIASFSVYTVYNLRGRIVSRGFKANFDTKLSWILVDERVVGTSSVRVDCPSGTHWRIQCHESRNILERTWLNPITQEERTSKIYPR